MEISLCRVGPIIVNLVRVRGLARASFRPDLKPISSNSAASKIWFAPEGIIQQVSRWVKL